MLGSLWKNLAFKTWKRLKRQASEEENEQSYHDIDWKRCYQENSVVKLKVKTLNKYLAYHQMNNCLKLKKKEKCDVIMQHIASLICRALDTN